MVLNSLGEPAPTARRGLESFRFSTLVNVQAPTGRTPVPLRRCAHVRSTTTTRRSYRRTSASPLTLRAKAIAEHIHRRHRRTQNERRPAAAQTSVSFCVLLWMHCRFGRRSHTKIPLTTDFADHTDDNKLDSPIRALRVIRGSEHPWFESSDAKSPRRTQIGRSSGAKCRETLSPQVVPPVRVRAQSQELRAQRAQNPGTVCRG